MNKLNKTLEIFIIGAISFALLFIWDSEIVYPVKLFVVLIHEINHAIAAVLTGGTVKSIKLSMDLSGYTITKGGNLIAIAAAGYLGSIVTGALLFLSSENKKLRLWLSSILAVIILILSVNLIEGGIQTFFGLLVSLILFLISRILNENINYYFFRVLGVISCFYVIADIKQDLLTTSLRETDTQVLEYLTGIPALLFGFIWFLIAIGVVFFVLKKSYIKKS